MRLIDKLKRMGAEALPIDKVDATTASVRLAICKGCKNYDAAGDECKICHCFMTIKTGSKIHFNPVKLRKEITHCPEGLWGDLEISSHYKLLDSKNTDHVS